MEENIIQIIPAPADMWAIFANRDGEDGRERVVCLALMEAPDGFRWISPVVCEDVGEFHSAYDVSNFICIEYGPEVQQ